MKPNDRIRGPETFRSRTARRLETQASYAAATLNRPPADSLSRGLRDEIASLTAHEDWTLPALYAHFRGAYPASMIRAAVAELERQGRLDVIHVRGAERAEVWIVTPIRLGRAGE